MPELSDTSSSSDRPNASDTSDRFGSSDDPEPRAKVNGLPEAAVSAITAATAAVFSANAANASGDAA